MGDSRDARGGGFSRWGKIIVSNCYCNRTIHACVQQQAVVVALPPQGPAEAMLLRLEPGDLADFDRILCKPEKLLASEQIRIIYLRF